MIFLFLILLILQTFNYTFDDIGVAVWSGFECINDRMVVACKTWVHQFPEVTIYADEFPNNSQSMLIELARPTKLVFFELGDCSQVFLGNPWEKAQPRFMKAMEHFFRYNSSKKFYFFCDDDSFPIAPNLMKLINEYDYNTSKVIGKFYCSWNFVVYGFMHYNDERCLPFAQGGAGVVVTQHYFSRIVDFLEECNNKYSSRNYAGSMRFAKCGADHFLEEYDDDKIVIKRDDRFYSSSPFIEIQNGEVQALPVNFHKMTPDELLRCSYGVRTEWKRMTDNMTMYVDWSNHTGKPIEIYTDFYQKITYRFGFVLAENSQSGIIGIATSPLIPIFRDDDKIRESPIGYRQELTNGMNEIVFYCDDTLPGLFFDTDHIENVDHLKINGSMKCPEPHEFQW